VSWIAAPSADAPVEKREKEQVVGNRPVPFLEKDFVRFPLLPPSENPAITTLIGRAFELPATCVRYELNQEQHLRFPLVDI
jgi:hypothetical protein